MGSRRLRGLWRLAGLAAFVGFTLLSAGCGPTGPQEPAGVQVPARLLYAEALWLEDQSLITEATAQLESLVTEHAGTRLGTFGYLKLGEVYAAQEQWKEADTAYRQFLALNSTSHFTPYVLYRLMVANYNLGITGIFFPGREVERDMEPNRRLALEFKRFFLLYPNSIYLDEVKPYYRAARDLLAQYELMVGDFYSDREHFNSAIYRYLYLLRNYPEYPDSGLVVEKLIAAYRANAQHELADEMEHVYGELFAAVPRSRPRTDGAGRGSPLAEP